MLHHHFHGFCQCILSLCIYLMLFLKSRHSFYVPVFYGGGIPSGSEVKNLPAIAGDSGFYPWVEKIPWRRRWHSWLGNPMGRGALWATVQGAAKESDMTWWLNNKNNFIMEIWRHVQKLKDLSSEHPYNHHLILCLIFIFDVFYICP